MNVFVSRKNPDGTTSYWNLLAVTRAVFDPKGPSLELFLEPPSKGTASTLILRGSQATTAARKLDLMSRE